MLSGYTHCELRTCNMPHCTQQHIPSLPHHRQNRLHTHIRETVLGPTSNVLIWWNAFPRYWIFRQPKVRATWARRPFPTWGRGIPRVPYVFIDHSSGDGRERWRIEGCCPTGHPVFWCQMTELEWVGLELLPGWCRAPTGSRRLFGWPVNSIPNIITVFLWTTSLAAWIQSTSWYCIALRALCNPCRRISSPSHFATGSQPVSQSISQCILASSLPFSEGLMPWCI